MKERMLMAIPEFNGIIGGTGYTCTVCHAPFTGDLDAFIRHVRQCQLVSENEQAREIVANTKIINDDLVGRIAVALTTARRAALEDAAKIADRYTVGKEPQLITLMAQHNTASDIAEEIRALKEN